MIYPVTDQDLDELNKRFNYHKPKNDQPERYQVLRDEAKKVAGSIMINCPSSRERSLALTALEEAIFWANAAIARNE